jgi:hypothetical protein
MKTVKDAGFSFLKDNGFGLLTGFGLSEDIGNRCLLIQRWFNSWAAKNHFDKGAVSFDHWSFFAVWILGPLSGGIILDF